MESNSLETIVKQLESTMDQADSRLDLLALRLDHFETSVLQPVTSQENPSVGVNESTNHALQDGLSTQAQQPGDDQEAQNDDDDGLDPKLVREILTEVTKVKNEYDQLHQELRQVQELQQEVTRSLRKQMVQVQSNFDYLRGRIISSGGGGNVPSSK